MKSKNINLEHVFESVSDGIFVTDLKIKLININSAGAQMIGKKPSELVGKSDLRLLSSRKKGKTMAKIIDMLKSENISKYSYDLNPPHDEVAHISVKAELFHGKDNRLRVLLG